jgi:RNA polymerase sigma-70 factor (ECF subfamily)
VSTVRGTSLTATTDADLVERAASGDVAAFESLVATRLTRAHRTASAILGNAADAHDVVQDAFVAAWRRLPTLRDRRRFDAWLNSAIVNRCRDVLRQRRRSRQVALDDTVEPWADDGTAQVDDHAVLAAAFEALSAEQRHILVMHHLHRVPVADLAAELGIPEGTLKWRLHAARAALDRALERER